MPGIKSTSLLELKRKTFGQSVEKRWVAIVVQWYQIVSPPGSLDSCTKELEVVLTIASTYLIFNDLGPRCNDHFTSTSKRKDPRLTDGMTSRKTKKQKTNLLSFLWILWKKYPQEDRCVYILTKFFIYTFFKQNIYILF